MGNIIAPMGGGGGGGSPNRYSLIKGIRVLCFKCSNIFVPTIINGQQYVNYSEVMHGF